MAKLRAPLFSLGASGALGKALVFFGWKGIDAVREYVIPSNPQTPLQTTQRDILKDGVAMIHEAMARATGPLVVADQTAYATLASAKGKIMTWFNQATKLWIDTKVDAEIPVIYSGGGTLAPAHDACRFRIFLNEETSPSLTHATFYYGLSKTNLILSKAATILEGDQAIVPGDDMIEGLSVGKKYYWQLRPDADKPCVGANSGIYSFVAT